ncbi:hypothetical protein [Rhodococcus jostii]|uniref:hypothetical protein n=1 Tax=Rhodococcus jostii TaxID=132919 RepID=UPI00362AEEF2
MSTTVGRQARRIGELVRFGMSGAPVSNGLVLLIWVLGAATSSQLGPTLYVERHFAAGIGNVEDGRVWTALTAGLWAPTLAGYVVTTMLILLVAAPIAPHRIRPVRRRGGLHPGARDRTGSAGQTRRPGLGLAPAPRHRSRPDHLVLQRHLLDR